MDETLLRFRLAFTDGILTPVCERNRLSIVESEVFSFDACHFVFSEST